MNAEEEVSHSREVPVGAGGAALEALAVGGVVSAAALMPGRRQPGTGSLSLVSRDQPPISILRMRSA